MTEPTRTAMWALAHPTRFRIWEILREGPATAARLAQWLGQSRGSMSYHLRILAGTGVIAEDAERGTKRERWWRRPDEPVLAPSDADPEGRAVDARLVAMLVRARRGRAPKVRDRNRQRRVAARLVRRQLGRRADAASRRTSSAGGCSRSWTSCDGKTVVPFLRRIAK